MRKNLSLILLLAISLLSSSLTFNVSGTGDYPDYISESENNIVVAFNKIQRAEKGINVDEYVSLLKEAVKYLTEAKKSFEENNYAESIIKSTNCNEVAFRIVKEINESLANEVSIGAQYNTPIRVIMLSLSLLIIHYMWLRYQRIYVNKVKSYGVVITE